MLNWIKNKWKNSKVNFYFLNLRWNVLFWLKCKKVYKNYSIRIKTDDFTIDSVGKMTYVSKTIQKKRFYGYMYKNNIYLDNPGMPIDNREQWENWREKKLIKKGQI